MGRLKYEREIEKSHEERRAVFVSLAWRCARNESLPSEEIEKACADAGKSVPDFRALVERVTARKQAVADLETAKKLAGQYDAVAAKLAAAVDSVRQAEARLAELQREQMAVYAESSALTSRIGSLRSHATNVLESTAGDGPDRSAVENVRLDDPAPQSAAVPLPSVATWHPGESAVLPSMRTVSRR